MAAVGDGVVFRVAKKYHAETVRTPAGGKAVTVNGSQYHPEMTEFAGIVAAVAPNGAADLVIFAPGKAPQWVMGLKEGDGDGQFQRSSPAAAQAEEHSLEPRVADLEERLRLLETQAESPEAKFDRLAGTGG